MDPLGVPWLTVGWSDKKRGMSIAAAADKCSPVAGSSKANENRLTSILKQLPADELRTFWSPLVPLPMALIASCHRLALASWMSDKGLISTLWRRKKPTGRKSTFCLLLPSLMASRYLFFFPPQDMWWLECCKVIGGITSSRAETQVIGSLVPLNRRGKMLKFIGWGKKSAPEYITQHQLFQGRERSDCSSGTWSSSQRLCGRHIAEVTLGIITAEWLQITNLWRRSWPSDHATTSRVG